MKFLLWLTILTTTTSAQLAPLSSVENVNLQKYLGKWYEIASLPQSFQKGCTATSAFYTKEANEDIKVLNKCNLGSPSGKEKTAEGRAWVVDTKSNSKLKVQFFLKRFKMNLFAGDYWILDLDKDYTHVIIGEPSRKYLWFLSRTKTMDSSLYKKLLNKATKMGFDIKKIVKTVH
ncbi:MAG: lipocalin family protein [Candidatus Cloacimonetes bacterium]|nr:lipocalin family protein [Candidatus Cloacimonadota bacterium]